MKSSSVLMTLLVCGGLSAQEPKAEPPLTSDLVVASAHAFTYDGNGVDGPGARVLRDAAGSSQFVLLGEMHGDHEIPLFAGSLFRLLQGGLGYRTLVVEQDPVAIEDALSPALRGDVDRLATHARRYNTLFEFDSDEDLALLAQVARAVKGPDAIWGVEQATGAVRYLEELVKLAPNAAARAKAQALLDAARKDDDGPKYTVKWLITPTTPAELADLAAAFGPTGRGAALIARLAKSAEIFGYYRRAQAGEFVGLYNNTVREEELKANFLRRYRSASKSGSLPKALFKFGANHLYHGRNPTQAFPIGNLAHELAIVNGSRAFGLYVVALGDGYSTYEDFPAWLRPLLPAEEPEVPTLVDLRPLRPYQRLFREKVVGNDQASLLALLHGYEAIVLLPGSRAASFTKGVSPKRNLFTGAPSPTQREVP